MIVELEEFWKILIKVDIHFIFSVNWLSCFCTKLQSGLSKDTFTI